MAAKTTVKVAVTNNAAKDDVFNLTQSDDNASGTFSLDVLANDPGSATLVSIGTPLNSTGGTTGQMSLTGTGTFSYGGAVIGTGNMKIENGKISFDLGGYNADRLAEGQSITFTVQYTAKMANGTLSTANVNVTIAGTNDKPVITSDVQAGSVVEDGTLTATGQVTSTDIDNGATATYTGNATTDNGTFSVNSANGTWLYTLNNTAAQSLALGETKTETFTVTVTDDKGATATQDVTITITGTNDAPVISSEAQTGAVAEDGTLIATGQVTSTDVDHGASAIYTGSAAGTYGAFAVAADGTWTYTLDNDAAQSLAAGETATETFTVTVTDDKGATATQDVTITVSGTNDAPVITSGTQSGSVTEDGTASASGAVTSTDVDNGASATYSGSEDSAYGNFVVAADGQWTYTIDNAAAQSLGKDEVVTETFTVTVDDGNGGTASQDVTITVNGVNDGPTLTSGAQIGSVTEDGTLTANGQVAANDVDGDTLTYSAASTAGTYGSISVDSATGAWVYTLANGQANVQALNTGDVRTDTFTVNVSDGNGGTTSQNVVVTINGADEPVVKPPLPAVVTTDNAGADANNFDNGAGATSANQTINGTNANTGDVLYGGAGNDTIDGKNGDDTLYGGSGNDTLIGGQGADKLYGGSGSDTIEAGSGNDLIYGGLGADLLTGDAGNDRFIYLTDADRGDFIVDYAAGDIVDVTALNINGYSSGPAANSIWEYGAGSTTINGTAYNGTVYAADTDGDVSTVEFWFVSANAIPAAAFSF